MQLLVSLTFRFSESASNYAIYGDDDTVLSDLRICLQLPQCDQLVILDGLPSLKAFAGMTVKNRKFDLLASADHDMAISGANLRPWVTGALNIVLERLLTENPKGFSTSDVYHELYYTEASDMSWSPLLFHQAQHALGGIWLRPQVQHAPPESQENHGYLTVALKLDGDPELPMIDEIIPYLQRLPHVELVECEDLSSPREPLTDFMRALIQAKRIRPLIRRIVARRQMRRVENLRKADPNGTTNPLTLSKLSLSQNHQPTYDWSKTMQYDDKQTFAEEGDKIRGRPQTHLGDRKRPRSPDTDQRSPSSTRLRSLHPIPPIPQHSSELPPSH